MRSVIFLTVFASLLLIGCGQESAVQQTADLAPPSEANLVGDAQHDMGINTEISLADAVSAAWRGAVIEVSAPEGPPQEYELPFGEAVILGETGLTATALVFVPDFVMGEDGISTRSAEAVNPALRLRVIEENRPNYEGWLFATMPEIHPFPHETYSILLTGGLAVD